MQFGFHEITEIAVGALDDDTMETGGPATRAATLTIFQTMDKQGVGRSRPMAVEVRDTCLFFSSMFNHYKHFC